MGFQFALNWSTNLRSPAIVSELRLASQRAHAIVQRRLSTVAAQPRRWTVLTAFSRNTEFTDTRGEVPRHRRAACAGRDLASGRLRTSEVRKSCAHRSRSGAPILRTFSRADRDAMDDLAVRILRSWVAWQSRSAVCTCCEAAPIETATTQASPAIGAGGSRHTMPGAVPTRRMESRGRLTSSSSSPMRDVRSRSNDI